MTDVPSSARSRDPRSLLEEASLGVAEAVLASPWPAAIALLASTCLFGDVRFRIGAAFLAGLAFSRSAAWTRRAAVIVVTCSVVAASWATQDGGASTRPGPGLALLWAGVALLAAAWGMRSTVLTVLGVGSLIAFNFSTVPAIRGHHYDAPTWWFAGWSVASFGLIRLGAAGWRRTAGSVALALCAADFVWRMSAQWRWTPSTGMFITQVVLPGAAAAILILCPMVAGLAARAARGVGPAPETARVIVLAQRRPWTAVTVVAAFAILLASMPATDHSYSVVGSFAWFVAAGLGAALMTALVAHSRGPLARLAPAAVSTAVLAISWGNGAFGLDSTAAVLWPLFACIVLRGACREGARRWATLEVLLFVLAVIGAAGLRSSTMRWAWLSLAPLAFMASAELMAPTRRLMAAAVALGVVSAVSSGLAEGRRFDSIRLLRGLSPVLISLWVLAGAYVVLARRARSLTAIPSDHPVIADFGETRPAVPEESPCA